MESLKFIFTSIKNRALSIKKSFLTPWIIGFCITLNVFAGGSQSIEKHDVSVNMEELGDDTDEVNHASSRETKQELTVAELRALEQNDLEAKVLELLLALRPGQQSSLIALRGELTLTQIAFYLENDLALNPNLKKSINLLLKSIEKKYGLKRGSNFLIRWMGSIIGYGLYAGGWTLQKCVNLIDALAGWFIAKEESQLPLTPEAFIALFEQTFPNILTGLEDAEKVKQIKEILYGRMGEENIEIDWNDTKAVLELLQQAFEDLNREETARIVETFETIPLGEEPSQPGNVQTTRNRKNEKRSTPPDLVVNSEMTGEAPVQAVQPMGGVTIDWSALDVPLPEKRGILRGSCILQ